ncbi:MAG: hypothetical protein ACI9Y1_002151 [Lentisphaeria bacterium]|jgi:hypothetical protein
MERITISNAMETLNELLKALTAAYWDANSIAQKDTVFDIVSTINDELNELAKLSINDFSMGYEPITAQFSACQSKLRNLQQNIDSWFPRTDTALNLNESLYRANNIITQK